MTGDAEARTAAPAGDAARTLRRDALLLLVLVAVHEACRHALAGGVVVSALLAPAGIETVATLLLGLSFVTLRVVLFVGVPGWLVAQGVLALSRRCLCRG